MHTIRLLISVALLVTAVHSYKVLFLVPFTGPSHWLMLKHFIRELTERGNEVTCLTSFKFGEPLGNYTEVLIDPAYPIREKCEFRVHFDSEFDILPHKISNFQFLFRRYLKRKVTTMTSTICFCTGGWDWKRVVTVWRTITCRHF